MVKIFNSVEQAWGKQLYFLISLVYSFNDLVNGWMICTFISLFMEYLLLMFRRILVACTCD